MRVTLILWIWADNSQKTFIFKFNCSYECDGAVDKTSLYDQALRDHKGFREALFLKRSKYGNCPEGGGGSTIAQMLLEHFFMALFGQNAKRGVVKAMPKVLEPF